MLIFSIIRGLMQLFPLLQFIFIQKTYPEHFRLAARRLYRHRLQPKPGQVLL